MFCTLYEVNSSLPVLYCTKCKILLFCMYCTVQSVLCINLLFCMYCTVQCVFEPNSSVCIVIHAPISYLLFCLYCIDSCVPHSPLFSVQCVLYPLYKYPPPRPILLFLYCTMCSVPYEYPIPHSACQQ